MQLLTGHSELIHGLILLLVEQYIGFSGPTHIILFDDMGSHQTVSCLKSLVPYRLKPQTQAVRLRSLQHGYVIVEN